MHQLVRAPLALLELLLLLLLLADL